MLKFAYLWRKIHVQGEPFEANGEHTETFAEGNVFQSTGFGTWKSGFLASFSDPLAIGDGRFLELGLMAPLQVRPERM